MHSTEFNSLQERCDTENPTLTAPPAPFEPDIEKYLDHLDDFAMSDDQKRELLEALWSIMRSFVELGFDVKACGQFLKSFNSASDESPDGVECSDPTNSGRLQSLGKEGGNA